MGSVVFEFILDLYFAVLDNNWRVMVATNTFHAAQRTIKDE